MREFRKISIDNMVIDLKDIMASDDMNECVAALLRKEKKRCQI